MSTIAIVVAAAENGAIGAGNRLLWHLPDDLKRFKALTLGKPVIMGRRTYESIGRPLPGRTNIVVTRRGGFEAPGCIVAGSLDEAFAAAAPAGEIAVIGGADVYRQALPHVNLVHLTRVHAEVEGDAFFPDLPAAQWREIAREPHPADERHAMPFTFITLERIAS